MGHWKDHRKDCVVGFEEWQCNLIFMILLATFTFIMIYGSARRVHFVTGLAMMSTSGGNGFGDKNPDACEKDEDCAAKKAVCIVGWCTCLPGNSMNKEGICELDKEPDVGNNSRKMMVRNRQRLGGFKIARSSRSTTIRRSTLPGSPLGHICVTNDDCDQNLYLICWSGVCRCGYGYQEMRGTCHRYIVPLPVIRKNTTFDNDTDFD